MLRVLLLLAALAITACGERERGAAPAAPVVVQDVRAVPIGRSPRFKPPAPAPDGSPRAGLRCGRAAARFGVHLELFAAGRVIVVPAGIGVAAPRRREGAYVRGGRCHYAIATTEPTGVVEVAHGTRARLGDLFAVWGAPLGPTRIASFRGRVRAFVDGDPWRGDPRAIPLRHHAQIVLAIGREVPIHSAFAFREGL